MVLYNLQGLILLLQNSESFTQFLSAGFTAH